MRAVFKPGAFAALIGALLVLAFAPAPRAASTRSGKASARPAVHGDAPATASIQKIAKNRPGASGILSAARMASPSLASLPTAPVAAVSVPASGIAGRPSGRSPPFA